MKGTTRSVIGVHAEWQARTTMSLKVRVISALNISSCDVVIAPLTPAAVYACDFDSYGCSCDSCDVPIAGSRLKHFAILICESGKELTLSSHLQVIRQ